MSFDLAHQVLLSPQSYKIFIFYIAALSLFSVLL